MIQSYGIDTSVLVRLMTNRPGENTARGVKRLTALVQRGGEVFASNHVIGEAYIAVQHHYGVSKSDARTALLGVRRSGLVVALNGRSVVFALQAYRRPDLFDRLVTDEYSRANLQVLALDRKMATLPNVRLV